MLISVTTSPVQADPTELTIGFRLAIIALAISITGLIAIGTWTLATTNTPPD